MTGGWKTTLTCIAAGVLLCLSLPPFGWWPLAFVGLVVVDRVIADQPWATRWRRGWLIAMGCFVPGLSWMTALTAPGTVIACVAYSAMLASGIACAPPGRGRWLVLPGTWALAELVRWSWPFGGVPLANLAIGQVAGPLAPILRLGGPLLLLVATVAVGMGAAALVRRAWAPGAGLLLGVALLVVIATLAPSGHTVGHATVAAVQGGGPQGTRQSDANIEKVFRRHVDATAMVEDPVDLIVWPEDVIDTPGPLPDDPWGEVIGDLAREHDAPMIVGTVEDAGLKSFKNSSQLWSADGEYLARYDKVHRVPFGEWVPFRSLLTKLAGDALPERDALIGELPNHLDVPGPVGRVTTPISWEVFFPERTREGVEDGARLVINPTNGSSFTGTIVQTQQVASSRMRAIENGRWVVQVAPTGFTAIVDDHGRVLDRTAISKAKVLQGDVELREGLTIYTRWGNLLGLLFAVAGILGGWTAQLRSQNRRR